MAERCKDSCDGIYAMAECHVDDKMADKFHTIDFMYGLRYVSVNIVLPL